MASMHAQETRNIVESETPRGKQAVRGVGWHVRLISVGHLKFSFGVYLFLFLSSDLNYKNTPVVSTFSTNTSTGLN